MEIDLQYIWKSLNRFTESNLPHSGMRIRSRPYRSARFCLLPEYRVIACTFQDSHSIGVSSHSLLLYYVKQIRNYPSGHDRDITQKSESSLNRTGERLYDLILAVEVLVFVSLKRS